MEVVDLRTTCEGDRRFFAIFTALYRGMGWVLYRLLGDLIDGCARADGKGDPGA